MLKQEALWMESVLAELDQSQLFPVLNIGSSSEAYRRSRQPWIDQHIFAPLRAKGGEIVHTDIQSAEGVDLVGDLMDQAFIETLKSRQFGCVICSNLLEHLPNRDEIAHVVTQLVRPGGYIVVTCPYSYPYHPNPIDTLYRPNLEALESAFPGTERIRGEIVSAQRYIDDLAKAPHKLARLLLPFYKPKTWLGVVHRLGWLFRPYQASCLLLQTPLEPTHEQ